jgi:hypothetical protein
MSLSLGEFMRTAIVIALACVAGNWATAADAIRDLEKQGAVVSVDEKTPGKPVVKIVFRDRATTDAALALLDDFSELRELSICGVAVTDAGMAHLKGLKRLEKLDIVYTSITDAGVASLSPLRDLRSLNLDGSFKITDAGLRRLKDLSELRTLSVRLTRTSDAGIDELHRAMPELTIWRKRLTSPDAVGRGQPIAMNRTSFLDWNRIPEPPRLMIHDVPLDLSRPSAALDRMLAERPDGVDAWKFQAWNLSYNLSAEFDDYRDRYFWIVQGIRLLVEGAEKNEKDFDLLYDVGSCVSQKIGRADEARQFRKLFADDAELHKLLIVGFPRGEVLGPDGKPDNWLVGRQWYLKAGQIAAKYRHGDMGSHSPVAFYASTSMCQTFYAQAIESEGRFGDAAARAWKEAERQWVALGDIPLPAMFDIKDRSISVRMNDKESLEAEVATAAKELDALKPGLREAIRKMRLDALTPAERKAYELPAEKRTKADESLCAALEKRLAVSLMDVATQVPIESRPKAIDIAKKAEGAEAKLREVETQRMIANFDYWRLMTQIEQTPEVLSARESIYLGKQAATAGRLDAARQSYERGFAQWRMLLDKKKWPDLKRDPVLAWDLADVVTEYRKILNQLGVEFPKGFILQDMLDLHEKERPKDAVLLHDLLDYFEKKAAAP